MKKKLTLLFLALVTSIGAWATDISVGTSTGTFYNDGTNAITPSTTYGYAKKWVSSSTPVLTVTCNNNNMVINSGDATETHLRLHQDTYTMTVSEGYIITGFSITGYAGNGTSKINNTTVGTTAETATTVTSTNIKVFSTSFSVSGTADPWMYITNFTVSVEEEQPVSVTYNVVDASGNVVASTTGAAIVGTAPSLPSDITNDYCTYGSFYGNSSCTGDAVTEITSETALYTQLSVSSSCPITFSTAESPVYYYLKLRDMYLYAEDADATYPSIQSNVKSTKEGAWAFIGNPYSFKIINKIVTGKYLARNTDVVSGAANGTTFSTTGTDWQMAPHYKGNGFRIYEPLASSLAHIYSNNTSVMWLSWAGTSGDDNRGGEFVPTPYSDDFTKQVAANIKPYFDKYTNDGEVYFGITSATKNSYYEAYTSALTSCTESEYETLYNNIKAGIKYPSTGYYRLKNKSAETYLGYTTSLTGTLSATSAASVAYIESSSDGVFSILLQGKQFVQMPSGHDVEAGTSSSAMSFTATIAEPGIITLLGPNPSNAFQCFGVSGNEIVGLGASDQAAMWSFEDATTFIGTLTDATDNTGEGHSYATLCVPFAIISLSGASAYTPTLSGNSLDMGEGASSVVAGTPVMLVGATNAGTYIATINTASAPASAVASATLSGTFTGTSLDCTAATGTTYVLGFDAENDNRIGFYHVNNTAFALNANRAYLNKESDASGVKGYVVSFDDDATSIKDLNDLKDSRQTIYNLAGQRISKAQKGVNIVNGKKIAIK